eukprot:4378033-Ditylum_brightwellii.AAC.1
MGLKVSSDIAQALIEEILRGLGVETYINDVGVFTNGSFEDHMTVVHFVLRRLEENGCKINPLK